MFEDKIAERILEWGKKEVGPFEVQFNPTNRCNLRCRFCWLRDFDKGGLNLEELSTKKYLEIVKECSKMGVHTIEITGGGEPLMRKDSLTLMKSVKRHKIYGRLITNGTLFSENMLNTLIKIGWDEIVFSLDAPERSVNDYLRGKSFDRVVKTIKTLQIMKVERKKEKPAVNIHMVLCNKNFHLLPKMFEFAYDLNCRNLVVEPIVLLATKTKAGRELLFRKKDKNSLLKFIREATKIAHKHNFQTNIDKLEFKLIESTTKMKKIVRKEGEKEEILWASLACYQPFYHIIIRPWGIVGPCCMFDNTGENIAEKSLREIWFGEFFEKMRKKMLDRNLPNFCSKCNPSQIQENRKIREYIKRLSD
ncbi:MAG: radical SAM protein [Candidatus Aenigmatarchaeota archaeon]